MAKWIQKAIEHENALRDLAKSEGAIGSDNKIKADWLEKKSHEKGKVGERARLALILRKMPHKGK